MLKPLFPLLRPLIHWLDPELAHVLTLESLQILPQALTAWCKRPAYPSLHQTLFGKLLPNPLGLAAGFDKDGEVIDAMFGLGFGMVEVGTVTPRSQSGNPKPRLFRLPEAQAVINRLGFNNAGHVALNQRLHKRLQGQQIRENAPPQGLLGVNIGANRDSEDRIKDYVAGVRLFAPMADYLVINISSPNTPGLRDLQSKEALTRLLEEVGTIRDRARDNGVPTPLVLKIAPNLSLAELDDVVTVARAQKLDGMIVSNTTLARPEPVKALPHGQEQGGLSGRPLFQASTAMLAQTYLRVENQFPLIGCGGVDSPASAFAKICAGASAVQLYTALIYKGPGLISDCVQTLAAYLEQQQAQSLAQFIGCQAKEFAGQG